MVDHSFPKKNRLRTRKDFFRVYERGKKVVGSYFTFYLFLKGETEQIPRIGISVSSQVGKAVERNRIKRLLREAFRKNKEIFGSYDFVVAPKEKAQGVENRILTEAFLAEFRDARKRYEEGPNGPK